MGEQESIVYSRRCSIIDGKLELFSDTRGDNIYVENYVTGQNHHLFTYTIRNFLEDDSDCPCCMDRYTNYDWESVKLIGNILFLILDSDPYVRVYALPTDTEPSDSKLPEIISPYDVADDNIIDIVASSPNILTIKYVDDDDEIFSYNESTITRLE
jgi:hypothetical protein